ncbi:hypothetical protein Tco_0788451 [Tanacetum coccineum]
MSDLRFTDTHNLVLFLEKPTKSEGFEQIVDFLNANSICYALTVNPTVYSSCIQQFWATAEVKTVNGEAQLQALVDGKQVIVTESIIKRYLQLQDAEDHSSGYTKTNQHWRLITSLKKKVKKLERRNKSRTPGLKRLRKVGSARRVESSDEASLGDQEDASKQGRKIADIDADAEVTLIDETQGRNDDNLMFDTCVLDEQEVEVEKVVSTAEVTTESATTTTVDELTLAQTLIEIKAAKPKVRGVMIQEPSEFTTTTTTTTPAASKPSQDKGKAKMIESEKPLKKKDQIMYNQELKGFKFEVIKDMFDKAFNRVNTFVDYKIELVEGSEKRAEDSTKRAGTELEQEVAKNQKIDDAKVDDDQE